MTTTKRKRDLRKSKIPFIKRKSYWDKKCLELWSLIIRSKGQCEYVDPFTGQRCQITEGLQPHHFYGRNFWPLRHDLANGVCVCNWHHRVAEQYSSIFDEFMREHRGDDFAYCREVFRSQQDRKFTLVDYEQIRAHLTARLKLVDAAGVEPAFSDS